MKKKKKVTRKRKSLTVANKISDLGPSILKDMNPSEPVPGMIGLSRQIERDLFQQPVSSLEPGQVTKTLLDTVAAADKAKEDEECCLKGFLSVIGALALIALVVYGGVLGYGYLTRPKAGECYNHWLFDTKARVESVEKDNVRYQYARYVSYPGDIGFNDRTIKSFSESFPKKVDCSKFFDLREDIRHDKDFEQYIDVLKGLRKQLDEEKAKNAHRPSKR